MSAAEQSIPVQRPDGPACGYWMRRQKAYCARQVLGSNQRPLRCEGNEIRDIVRLMGHDNELTFQRVYAHRLDPESVRDDVAQKMNELFTKKPGRGRSAA